MINKLSSLVTTKCKKQEPWAQTQTVKVNITFSILQFLGVDFQHLLQLAYLVRLLVYHLSQVLQNEAET